MIDGHNLVESCLTITSVVQERHWKRMEELTSHTFDVESESFQLKNIMDAPLLEFRDDIEVSAGSVRVWTSVREI